MPVSERRDDREQQHAGVRVQIDRVGLQERRPERPEQRLRPVREQQAGRAAEHREQRALREQLQDQPPRLAPSDSRTAISFWRTAARASSRFATFAHAISSTSPTIAISTPPAATMLFAEPGVYRRLRQSGTSVTLRPWFSFGYSCASWRAIVFRFASRLLHADARLQPPVTLNASPRRLSGFIELLQKSARRLLIRHVRHPQRRRADRVGALEAFRHDADDGEVAAVDLDRAARRSTRSPPKRFCHSP